MRTFGMSSIGIERLSGRGKLLPIYWVVLSTLILVGDYATGPHIQFPILYVIPVVLASWYSGFGWGFGLSLCMPLLRFSYATMLWLDSVKPVNAALNSIIRICVLSLLAFLVDHAAKKTREIRVLKGLLPICCFCKKIRSSDHTWVPLETYILEHSNSEFTHGYCPECVKEQYGIDLTRGSGPRDGL